MQTKILLLLLLLWKKTISANKKQFVKKIGNLKNYFPLSTFRTNNFAKTGDFILLSLEIGLFRERQLELRLTQKQLFSSKKNRYNYS